MNVRIIKANPKAQINVERLSRNSDFEDVVELSGLSDSLTEFASFFDVLSDI